MGNHLSEQRKAADVYESWILEKEFRFEASHQLPNHGGKCKRLHGHSWVGRVKLLRSSLVQTGPSQGMVLDYGIISQFIRPIVENYLDHRHLNDTTGLENPTSEELARWIYNRLDPLFDGLVSVTVEETCTCRCEYRRSE